MADRDDFLDDYIGYRIFEDSMKKRLRWRQDT